MSSERSLSYFQKAYQAGTDTLLAELRQWPGPVVKRHNDAKLYYHKLVFLADLGFRADQAELANITERMLESQSREGPFQVISNIPRHFGGSGEDENLWMLCDAPLLSYALIKMGYREDPRVQKSVTYLLDLIQEFGWPCAASPALGQKFRGPGKKSHPCPYANLIMLRLLTALPGQLTSEYARVGAETLLHQWENRTEIKYYLFGMGRDFKKLKAPFIWFDLMHVTEVLTRFPFLRGDPRLDEMVEEIKSKQDAQGQFRAESVYRAWKEWDFGQKKEPSPWITYKAHRIISRWNKLNRNEKSA